MSRYKIQDTNESHAPVTAGNAVAPDSRLHPAEIEEKPKSAY